MRIFNSIWILLNFVIIILILVRNPNEQSLQETLSPLQIFESSTKGAQFLDKIISILVISYFVLGFLFTTKVFY